MLPKVGLPELVIVLAIVLLIFGVGRLGKLGRELGEGIREFRKGLAGNGDEEGEQEETTQQT